MSSWNSGYVTEIDYTHGFYKELTPALLSYFALLHGYQAPGSDLQPISYCELGCGQGYTVNVLAAANPHVQFYANDFNPTHIAKAQSLAHAAKTQNIHLSDDSFDEYLKRTDLPDFDFIVLHGIYSWVSAEARKDIVRFIHTKLKPGGVVYISYNCMPGWAPLMPLRRLLVEHADYSGTSRSLPARIGSSVEFVQKLANAGAAYFAKDPAIVKQLETMQKYGLNYMAHEYFNRDWNPFYFMDVAQELSEAKLTWVGSIGYLDSRDALHLTQEQSDILAGIDDIHLRETLRDHIFNKQFRQDIFIKGPIKLSKQEAKQRWLDTRFIMTDRTKLSQTIRGRLHTAELNPDLFKHLTAALEKGPRCGSEIVQLPELANFNFNSIIEMLAFFVEQEGCQPCLPEEGQTERKMKTDLFNKTIAERARSSDDLGTFASGVTGTGISHGRLIRLMWLAAHNQQKDLIEAVWQDMRQAGLQVNKEGKALHGKEALAQLQANLLPLEEKMLSFWRLTGLI